MARLNWCLAAVISWGKFLFACFFPLRGAKRDTVSLERGGGGTARRQGAVVNGRIWTDSMEFSIESETRIGHWDRDRPGSGSPHRTAAVSLVLPDPPNDVAAEIWFRWRTSG